MKTLLFGTPLVLAVLLNSCNNTQTITKTSQVYADFPVTLKTYTGDKTSSVGYTGQIARYTLHDSLKTLVKSGDKEKMMMYFSEKGEDRAIIAPATKGNFKVKQTTVGELSNPDLKGKTYKGALAGWFGMTGAEAIEFMIDKASQTKGYDLNNGYDYTQLISKTLIGAVFYNQIVNNYLAGKLDAGTKPNNKPYKDGTQYTGKEHSWDEGFGYFGAPAHGLTLTPSQIYNIAKQKDFVAADYNKDGVIDLYDEMTYALAYYAAGADKSSQSTYFKDIMSAFIAGRSLITSANGEVLIDSQRAKLKGYAQVIKDNLRMVIAEAIFKYAGKVYEDINKMEARNGDMKTLFRAYAKHWGELKGFSLALQMGDKNLGDVTTKLNRLVGLSPVLLGGTQVSDIDTAGNYVQSSTQSMQEYSVHMLKIQNLMKDTFGITALASNHANEIEALTQSLGSKSSAEND